MRFEWGWIDAPGALPAEVWLPSILIGVYWLILFLFSGLYRNRFASSRMDELISIGKVVTVGMLILFFLLFIDKRDAYSGRLPIFLYWMTILFTIIVGRMTIRYFQKRRLLHGIGLHNSLVLGFSDLLPQFLDEINRYPEAGFRVVGLMALDEKPDWHTLQSRVREEVVMGQTVEDLPALIEQLHVQDVLITLDSRNHEALADILRICDGHSVSLKVVPDFYTLIGGLARTEHMYGLPLIEVAPEPMTPWEQSTKRLIDVVIALIGLLTLWPFLLLVGLLIRISSSGPAIYRQQRVGQRGKRFTMYKFRTMYQDAESRTGPVWATPNDPRYTPVGRWLRKLRMDELPQLWNVLAGQMSLVGPRPERPFFVEKLSSEIPLYHRRLRVKPGITGLAQVKWKYDQSLDDVRQKVKYDLLYIENMSLKQDFSILIQTIRTALMGMGH